MQLIALMMGLLVPALAQPADKIARDAIQSVNAYGNSYQANPSVEVAPNNSPATTTQISHPGPTAVAAGQQDQQTNNPGSSDEKIQNTVAARLILELVFTGNTTEILPFYERAANIQEEFDAKFPNHRKSVQEAAPAASKTAQDASKPSATTTNGNANGKSEATTPRPAELP